MSWQYNTKLKSTFLPFPWLCALGRHRNVCFPCPRTALYESEDTDRTLPGLPFLEPHTGTSTCHVCEHCLAVVPSSKASALNKALWGESSSLERGVCDQALACSLPPRPGCYLPTLTEAWSRSCPSPPRGAILHTASLRPPPFWSKCLLFHLSRNH